MNERIQAIKNQCWVYRHWDKNGERWVDRHVDLDKFAELIIQECIAQCEYVANDADEMSKSDFVTDAGRMLHKGIWGGAKNCSGRIKYHFEVETD